MQSAIPTWDTISGCRRLICAAAALGLLLVLGLRKQGRRKIRQPIKAFSKTTLSPATTSLAAWACEAEEESTASRKEPSTFPIPIRIPSLLGVCRPELILWRPFFTGRV